MITRHNIQPYMTTLSTKSSCSWYTKHTSRIVFHPREVVLNILLCDHPTVARLALTGKGKQDRIDQLLSVNRKERFSKAIIH
jgi:uncharacterized protein (DUF2461 family)